MSEPIPDAVPYTNFRIALASAILGSVGATLGWILWLSIEVGLAALLLTAAVGAAVGIAVHWVQHYVHVASLERSGESAQSVSGREGPWWRRVRALLWAGGFSFLGLASEHLVAQMAADYLHPFIASLTSLIPAGAIIGWTMSRGRPQDENLVLLIANGLWTGAMITLVTAVIWAVGFGTVPWFALFSWWGLVGIGTRIFTGTARNDVSFGDPIGAVVFVFVATFLINLLPATTATYTRYGAPGNFVLVVRTMAAGIQRSPGLPATFWLEAEARRTGVVDSSRLRVRVGKPILIDTSAIRPRPVDLQRAVDSLTAPAPAPGTSELQLTPRGWQDFARSWTIILLFAIGLGLAPRVERSLRPIDYPNSETYHKDVILAVVVVLLVVAACIGARATR